MKGTPRGTMVSRRSSSRHQGRRDGMRPCSLTLNSVPSLTLISTNSRHSTNNNRRRCTQRSKLTNVQLRTNNRPARRRRRYNHHTRRSNMLRKRYTNNTLRRLSRHRHTSDRNGRRRHGLTRANDSRYSPPIITSSTTPVPSSSLLMLPRISRLSRPSRLLSISFLTYSLSYYFLGLFVSLQVVPAYS